MRSRSKQRINLTNTEGALTMKDSLKEQLARLAKSGELNPTATKTNLAEATKPSNPNPVAAQKPKGTSEAYESMILELDELRAARSKLTQECNSLKATLESEVAALRAESQDLNSRLKKIIQSNKDLAEENLNLKRKLENMPTAEAIQGWRERAKQADMLIRETNESIEELHAGQQQLTADRSAFENQIERLDQLDTLAKALADEKQRVAGSEIEAQKRLAELEKTENKLSLERSRLDKLSAELQELQSNVGRFKGIDRTLKALEADHLKISKLYETSKTRIRNLTTDRDHALEACSKAESNTRKIGRELKDALSQLRALPDGELVIRSFETVQWLTSQFVDPNEAVVPKKVLLIGDGPWPIDNFTDLLNELGFDVWQNGCDANIEIVIVGRENWSDAVIDGQIEERDGDSLRIYPQELFIFLLAMQADPLVFADTDALLKFVEGHPVFEYLFCQEFPWPETTFEDGPPATIGEGFDGEDASSPLYKMGYSVAQQVDLSSIRRQKILEETFAEKNLPWCISDEYMEDWGEANSRKRLRRIAWHLHLMMKRFRRHSEAVARWKGDLEWLKQTYYKPIHRFRWPS